MIVLHYLFWIKNLLCLMLIPLICFLLFIAVIAEKKVLKIIFISILGICSLSLVIGGYNAYFRPKVEKSDIKSYDIENMIESLIDGTYQSENFLKNYQILEQPSNSSTNQPDMYGDGNFNGTFEARVIHPSPLTAYECSYTETRYSSKEEARREYFITKSTYLESYGNSEKYSEIGKEKMLLYSTTYSSEEYEFFIFPTLLYSHFIDIGSDAIDNKMNTIIGVYDKSVFVLYEANIYKKLYLAKLLKKQALFDPEFKGL